MCAAVRRRPRGEEKQKGPTHWGGKTQKSWPAAWQPALPRDLYPPDPPNEGICESLKKCLFLYATNDKTVSHNRRVFVFPE